MGRALRVHKTIVIGKHHNKNNGVLAHRKSQTSIDAEMNYLMQKIRSKRGCIVLHCFKLQCGLKAYNYLHGLIAAAFRRDLIGFCAVVAPAVVTRHVPRRFQRRHIHFVLFELLMLRNEPTCSSGGRGRSWGGRGRRGQMEGMLSGGTNRTLAGDLKTAFAISVFV
jgi:hypothetical protein